MKIKIFQKIKLLFPKKQEQNHVEFNGWSIFFIIILDIFVLYNLFIGIDKQSDLVVQTWEFIPQQYYDMIIKKDWYSENIVGKIERLMNEKSNFQEGYKTRYEYNNNLTKPNKYLNQNLKKIQNELIYIKNDKYIQDRIIAKKRLEKEQIEIQKNYNRFKSDYETLLFSKIANDPNENKKIKTQYEELQKELQYKDEELDKIYLSIKNDKKIVKLLEIIQNVQKNYSDSLLKEYNKKEKLIPLFEFFYQILFILPILLFFLFWNIYSVKNNKYIQNVIAINLLAVSAIPIFWKLFVLGIDIFPRTAFTKIYKFLVALKIVGIWYYLLILIGICFSIFLIYFIGKMIEFKKNKAKEKAKKNEFKKRKILARNINNCYKCGFTIDKEDDFCILCGTLQKVECVNCREKNHILNNYCYKCGKEILNDTKGH